MEYPAECPQMSQTRVEIPVKKKSEAWDTLIGSKRKPKQFKDSHFNRLFLRSAYCIKIKYLAIRTNQEVVLLKRESFKPNIITGASSFTSNS